MYATDPVTLATNANVMPRRLVEPQIIFGPKICTARTRKRGEYLVRTYVKKNWNTMINVNSMEQSIRHIGTDLSVISTDNYRYECPWNFRVHTVARQTEPIFDPQPPKNNHEQPRKRTRSSPPGHGRRHRPWPRKQMNFGRQKQFRRRRTSATPFNRTHLESDVGQSKQQWRRDDDDE